MDESSQLFMLGNKLSGLQLMSQAGESADLIGGSATPGLIEESVNSFQSDLRREMGKNDEATTKFCLTMQDHLESLA